MLAIKFVGLEELMGYFGGGEEDIKLSICQIDGRRRKAENSRTGAEGERRPEKEYRGEKEPVAETARVEVENGKRNSRAEKKKEEGEENRKKMDGRERKRVVTMIGKEERGGREKE
ncbi:hypothetical protein Tco_0832716 [Tanacetum coccineum]